MASNPAAAAAAAAAAVVVVDVGNDGVQEGRRAMGLAEGQAKHSTIPCTDPHHHHHHSLHSVHSLGPVQQLHSP